MTADNCPKREQLSAYLLGTLPEEQVEPLIHHVENCPQCETAIGDLESTADDLVSQIRQPVADDRFAKEARCREALSRAVQIGQALPPAEEALTEAVVAGNLGQYRLLEKLGQGGMGAVYKARHAKLDRIVALKVLPKGRIADQQAVARFEREMKAVGRLDHPNIVRATDAGEVDGTPFLVMEYVEGLDLEEVVRRCGRLPVADACELIRQAAVGLQAAHEHGLVHRDIKPSNLMFTADGTVKLLDLGLARFHTEPPVGEEVTAAGQLMGTADYMAPEQTSDSRTVDVRADVYSLGCTLYRLLSGEAPFGGPQYAGAFQKMMAHVRDPIPPIQDRRGDLPDGLVAVLNRLLAKDPAERPAVPAEVSDALGPFCAGCDLPGLFARAEGRPAVAPQRRRPVVTTKQFRSSALAGTEPKSPSERPRREVSVQVRVGHLGCAVVITAACLLIAATIFVFQNITHHGTMVARAPEGDAPMRGIDKKTKQPLGEPPHDAVLKGVRALEPAARPSRPAEEALSRGKPGRAEMATAALRSEPTDQATAKAPELRLPLAEPVDQLELHFFRHLQAYLTADAPAAESPKSLGRACQKTAARIDSEFRVADAKTAAQKRDLAKKLLESGKQAERNTVEQFVLLHRAVELAVGGGDAALGLEALDALEARFHLDVSEIKQKYFAELLQAAPAVPAENEMPAEPPAEYNP